LPRIAAFLIPNTSTPAEIPAAVGWTSALMEFFYLDIGAMIRRLQQHPDEFEITPNCIRHRPSRHRLSFQRDGNGRIVARCNSSALPVSREQGMALRVAISNWEGFSRQPSIAARRPSARADCVKSATIRYFMVEIRWRQAIKAVRPWFTINLLRRRHVSRPDLRIVSSRPEGALARADTSGAASQQREQRLSGRRPIAAIGQSTSSTPPPPPAAPMTKEVMR
jgi:hypothetical protein